MRRVAFIVITVLGLQPIACSFPNDSADGDDDTGTDTGSNADTHTDRDTDSDAATVPKVRHLNPGRPAYASDGNALKCNDGAYGVDFWGVGTEKNNTWTAASPAWCALDLGNVTAAEILVTLSDEQGTSDIEGFPRFRNYTIETSADSTDGDNGTWRHKVSVTENTFGYRLHRLPFSGERWIRVTVRSPRTAVIDELDVFDVSDEPDDIPDSIIWVGDSITARCADRHGTFGANPSLQTVIHRQFADRFPIQIGAGNVSMSTAGMLEGDESKMDALLALYPEVRFWGLLLGTNDSIGDIPDEEFRNNLISLVNKIEDAGHQAIIAKIPCTASKTHGHATERLNAVIDKVTRQKKLTPGPDLYSLFKHNAGTFYDDRDHVHPNSAGCTAWQESWAAILTDRFGR